MAGSRVSFRDIPANQCQRLIREALQRQRVEVGQKRCWTPYRVDLAAGAGHAIEPAPDLPAELCGKNYNFFN
jgi:hypothetical protein